MKRFLFVIFIITVIFFGYKYLYRYDTNSVIITKDNESVVNIETGKEPVKKTDFIPFDVDVDNYGIDFPYYETEDINSDHDLSRICDNIRYDECNASIKGFKEIYKDDKFVVLFKPYYGVAEVPVIIDMSVNGFIIIWSIEEKSYKFYDFFPFNEDIFSIERNGNRFVIFTDKYLGLEVCDAQKTFNIYNILIDKHKIYKKKVQDQQTQ